MLVVVRADDEGEEEEPVVNMEIIHCKDASDLFDCGACTKVKNESSITESTGEYTFTYTCVRCSERGPTEEAREVTGTNYDPTLAERIDLTKDCDGHDITFFILMMVWLGIMVILGIIFTAIYLVRRRKVLIHMRNQNHGYQQASANADPYYK